MEIKELISELEEIWIGSGYQIKSIKKYLKDDLGLGFEESGDRDITIFSFRDKETWYTIPVTFSGYEILLKYKGYEYV